MSEQDLRQQAVRRRLAGESPEQIAAALGRTSRWVRKWVARHGDEGSDEAWAHGRSKAPSSTTIQTSVVASLHNRNTSVRSWRHVSIWESPHVSSRYANRGVTVSSNTSTTCGTSRSSGPKRSTISSTSVSRTTPSSPFTTHTTATAPTAAQHPIRSGRDDPATRSPLATHHRPGSPHKAESKSFATSDRTDVSICSANESSSTKTKPTNT